MDPLLFGDNQFFGVNHMSEDKARAQAIRFQNLDSVTGVLKTAHDSGVTTFMCTTHERIAEVCEVIRAHPTEFPNQTFYPCMPYAHKYANAVTELGVVGSMRRFLPDEGLWDATVRGGRSLAKKDIEGLITLLIDAEMKMFAGLPTPAVFLQNVVTDLLLGLGAPYAFRVFADHVRERYGAEPGFITMNLPYLLDALAEAGLERPLVCANINKLGFRMSGGTAAYADRLERSEARVIAMSVFASGAIDPREALEWVYAQPNIESVVFGASSAHHIRETKQLADELAQEAAR